MKRISYFILMTGYLISLTGHLWANPIWPAYLTEVRPDTSAPFIIEIYNNGAYNYLDGFKITTSSGTAEVLPGIPAPWEEYIALSTDDFQWPPTFQLEGDYVYLEDGEGYLLGEMSYGEDPADCSAPGAGQSINGHFYVNEYDELIINFWYLDNSPTFAAENDTAGAVGTVQGTVVDHYSLQPVQGVVVTCLESEFQTVTDEQGFYSLRTYSLRSTLQWTAAGYYTRSTLDGELDVVIDSTIVYDVHIWPTSGIESPADGDFRLPRSFSLSQNFPNPFNPVTVIEFMIPGFVEGEMPVMLRVYDSRSRLVRTLFDDKRRAGTYRVPWDGKDDNGVRVGSGAYFYTIRAEDFTSTRKMIVLN